MQLFREIVREAFIGLARNRTRALLSMLGISWGIVSVVMLLSYGDGFREALARGFRGAFGDGVVITWPGQTSQQAGGERAGKRIRLKLEDVLAVSEAPLVKFVSPEFTREFPIAWGMRQGSYMVRGVSPEYAVMRSQWVAAGRFPDAEDLRLQRRVAFIGSEVARKMFGNTPPVGQRIRIGGMAFEVAGVQKEKVQLSNYLRPDRESIFIPYTTAGQLWNTEFSTVMVYQAVDATKEAQATAQVKALLGKRLNFNPGDDRALRMFGSTQTAEITAGIVLGLKLVLGFIGVLTLAIGGIGVMNIMFVSVTERTRGDRHPEGTGGQAPGDPAAVPARGDRNRRRRRRGWRGRLVAAGVPLQPTAVPVRVARRCEPIGGHSHDAVAAAAGGVQRHPDDCRTRQRARARDSCLAHGPHRGAQVRIGSGFEVLGSRF